MNGIQLDFADKSFKECIKELSNDEEITEDMIEACNWFKEYTEIEVVDKGSVNSYIYYSKSWDDVDYELTKLGIIL